MSLMMSDMSNTKLQQVQVAQQLQEAQWVVQVPGGGQRTLFVMNA